MIHDTITPTILNKGATAIEVVKPAKLWRARQVQPHTFAGLIVNSRLCLTRSRDFVRSDWQELNYDLRKNFNAASTERAVGTIVLDSVTERPGDDIDTPRSAIIVRSGWLAGYADEPRDFAHIASFVVPETNDFTTKHTQDPYRCDSLFAPEISKLHDLLQWATDPKNETYEVISPSAIVLPSQDGHRYNREIKAHYPKPEQLPTVEWTR